MTFGSDLKTLMARLLNYQSKDDVARGVDAAVGEWVQVRFTDAADATVAAAPSCYVPYPCRVKEVKIVSQITVAASNTDYKTYLLSAVTAGTPRTVATGDTRAASLNGLVLNVPEDLPLSGTSANLDLAAGDLLTVTATDSGTSPSIGQGLIFVRLEKTYS